MKDAVGILGRKCLYSVKHHQTSTGGLGACRSHVHNVLKALLQLSQFNGQGFQT